jgi:hypothetical protein
VVLFASGLALIFVAFLSHLLTVKKGAAEPHSTSQFSTGDGTANLAGNFHAPIHINHPPAPTQERKYPGGIPPRASGGGSRARAAVESKRCPEMPIWQAVEHVARVIGDTEQDESFPETRRQLRQAAAEGRIDVWGLKDIPPAHMQDERHSAVWTPIPPDYWHEYEINRIATIDRFDDRDHTQEESLPSRRGNRYWSLRVREGEIKGKWRHTKPAVAKAVEPDFPLNGLLIRVYGHYGYPRSAPSEAEQRRKINLLIMDKVVQRGLSVWGRQGDLPLGKLSAYALARATLDHRKSELRVASLDGDPNVYKDLHFNRAQVDAVWPDPLTTTNDGRP